MLNGVIHRDVVISSIHFNSTSEKMSASAAGIHSFDLVMLYLVMLSVVQIIITFRVKRREKDVQINISPISGFLTRRYQKSYEEIPIY